jgi:hypothetical protein
MVNFICSEWIPLENIRFKIGIFIDWEVVRLPPLWGGCWGEGGTVILDGKTSSYHRWCGGCGGCGAYGMDG